MTTEQAFKYKAKSLQDHADHIREMVSAYRDDDEPLRDYVAAIRREAVIKALAGAMRRER